MPAAVDKLHHYEGERPLFEQYDIDEEIELALGRRVELKSGGYLVFRPDRSNVDDRCQYWCLCWETRL